MLTKIREKAHGVIGQTLFIGISALFGLWGINSYTDATRETRVAAVGNKDFYQRDVNKAYEQYRAQFEGMGIDEETIKQQALAKLIKDEVMLQYVYNQGLVATDDTARDYIKSLPYFQLDGKFNDAQYKALLNSQRMTSAEFVSRIKNAIVMGQFQDAIMNSDFASDYDVESFFKIQNQQRDIEYVTVAVPKLTEQPTEQEITDYYQKHQAQYQIPEQMSVEYVELALADLAKKVPVSDDKLKAYYEEQKSSYSTPERRKISHILFKVNDKVDDKAALEKALKAKQDLASKDFASVAKEVSEDVSAKTGGDLGLFNAGTMDKTFEAAAEKLKLNEVSEPVKTPFGYHLIKVTELTGGETKPFDSVKEEVTKAYQKSQAESTFYESGETLSAMSFEHPDSLQAIADTLGLTIKKTPLFTKEKGEDIAAEDKIRSAAFAEETLQGNNSAPIELGTDRLIVLRQLEHKQAAPRDIKDVKADIIATLLEDKAKLQAIADAKKIAARLQAGEPLSTVAAEQKLAIKKETGLTRMKATVAPQLLEAVFKAAKPVGDKATSFIVPLANGEQVIVSLSKVTAGSMSEDDKKKLQLAKKNIANALAQNEFNSLLNALQTRADISITPAKEQATQ